MVALHGRAPHQNNKEEEITEEAVWIHRDSIGVVISWRVLIIITVTDKKKKEEEKQRRKRGREEEEEEETQKI